MSFCPNHERPTAGLSADMERRVGELLPETGLFLPLSLDDKSRFFRTHIKVKGGDYGVITG